MIILVVDDDFQVLKSARLVLRGHETHIASDVISAVASAQRYRPDVVLLDVMLAHESGLEAIEPIRAVSPHTAVIVMTAMSSVDAMTLAYSSGADAFVPKHALPSLPAVLDDLLAERRQQHEL